MAAQQTDIRIVKHSSPASEEDARRKAEFDQSMVMIRHRVRYADPISAEYFFRQMMGECKTLARRFGLKVLPDDAG